MIEQKAMDIVNSLREPLLLLDDGVRVQFANAAFYRAFQVEPGHTVGRPLRELGNGQWNLAPLIDGLRELLAGGRTMEDFEIEHAFEDVGLRAKSLYARRMPSADDHPLALLVIEDITNRRSATAARDKHEGELERSNEALSQFAGMASHDLREPIRKLHSYAELLAESASARLDARETEYLRRIMSAADRMRRLVDAMLALSRVTRGALHVADVELGALAREAASDLEIRAREVSATVQVDTLPAARGDAALLRLLFQNLIENAIKFARPGHPPVVRISAKQRAASVDVEVRDNGTGFDPADAERMFEPFHRLHTREAVAGNGMGLAICRRVAARHGGSLTASSLPDAGASFVLTLPLNPVSAMAS